VLSGNINLVEFLISKDADINGLANARFIGTPLHIAVTKDCLKIVKFLIDHGAQVIENDIKCSKTPEMKEIIENKCREIVKIHYASFEGNIESIEGLLRMNYSINSIFPYESEGIEKYLSTPLHWATYNGQIKVVEYLVSHGADINAKTATVFISYFLKALFTLLL